MHDRKKGKSVDRVDLTHLSLLFVLPGICFPARAHSSPSDGCLNLKSLKKETIHCNDVIDDMQVERDDHTKVSCSPATAQQPACKGVMWSHFLHYADCQQADHQLNPHQCLQEETCRITMYLTEKPLFTQSKTKTCEPNNINLRLYSPEVNKTKVVILLPKNI